MHHLVNCLSVLIRVGLVERVRPKVKWGTLDHFLFGVVSRTSGHGERSRAK